MAFAILRRAYKVFRPHLIRSFLLTVFCCVIFEVLIWCFGLFDDLYTRTIVSLLIALVPIGFHPSLRTWQGNEETLWLMSFIGLALLLVLSDKFNWSVLAANVVLFLASLPYAWLVWKLMRRNWLLLAGLMLALAVMMVYWIAALIGQSDFLTLLLLPLPVVVFGGVIWTPIASWVFNTAQERKNHRSGGPGMQALAMIVLSLPVILVAVAAPGMLELGQVWSAVSLTLVGVLLSGLIADPLRRFLLEWGNLAPGPECPEK